FTALIDWGDGSNSAGSVVANANGGFSVVGTHTFTISASSTTGGFRFPRHGGRFGPQTETFGVAVTVHNAADASNVNASSVAVVTLTPPSLVAAGKTIQA